MAICIWIAHTNSAPNNNEHQLCSARKVLDPEMDDNGGRILGKQDNGIHSTESESQIQICC